MLPRCLRLNHFTSSPEGMSLSEGPAHPTAAGDNTLRGHLCDRGLQSYPPRRATSPDTATPKPLNKVKGVVIFGPAAVLS